MFNEDHEIIENALNGLEWIMIREMDHQGIQRIITNKYQDEIQILYQQKQQ